MEEKSVKMNLKHHTPLIDRKLYIAKRAINKKFLKDFYFFSQVFF